MKVEVATTALLGFVPERKHDSDAGYDMRAAIPRPITIDPGDSAWVPTGVKAAIPDGYFGLQCARSGLSCNHGITLANGVGVIDSGYRGEIKAKLVNLGKRPYTIFPDDRVCQLIILPYAKVDFVKVDELEDSDRGSNGYGSTGTR